MVAQQGPGRKLLLGEILLERGLVTKEQLEQALRVQVGGMRRLGSILVGMKILRVEQLTDALSEQLMLPVVKVEDEVRADVKTVLPRYLCRKYSVLPLSRESNNVLRLAMADPLDAVAVSDVEHFTGFVVQPVLARLSDIDRAIPAHVAFSRQDLFNPEMYRSVARVGVVASLVLLVVAGALGFREVRRQGHLVEAQERALEAQKGALEIQEHGTRTARPDGSFVYNHQDLTIDHAPGGSVFFSGRGVHADSYYGIRFEKPQDLSSFVEGARGQFSQKQIAWVRWVLETHFGLAEKPVVARSE